MINSTRTLSVFAAGAAAIFLAGVASAHLTDGCEHFTISCPDGREEPLLTAPATYMTCFSMLDTPANCYYDKQTGLIVEDPKGTEPDATVSGGCPHEAVVDCPDCHPGYEPNVDHTCDQCDPIHYSTGGTDTCKPCPTGSHVNWDQSGCIYPSGMAHKRSLKVNKRLPSWY